MLKVWEGKVCVEWGDVERGLGVGGLGLVEVRISVFFMGSY